MSLENIQTNKAMNIYMKTKKALAGLLGLLGSFAAFLLFFPALVAPVLFTESLQTRTNQKLFQKIQNTRYLRI